MKSNAKISIYATVIGTIFALFGRSAHAVPETLSSAFESEPQRPFQAQVVGLKWLNPLHRRDYSTEWQLLWTLGLVTANADDDLTIKKPEKYSKLQAIAPIAGNQGSETFEGYHHKYVEKLISDFHDIYYTSSRNFYNAATLDKKTWRELAGIHVEYAVPEGKIDPRVAGERVKDEIISTFSIGNPSFPTLWSRSTPPDVRVTAGGASAGFRSLGAALDYLQAHPGETVWVMNWDSPSFPQLDMQINENIVLLVLAGPSFKTERHPLAWIGYPATKSTVEFESKKGMPARTVQAWAAALETAAKNAGKQAGDVGFVIHDANNRHADSSDRLAHLAQALTSELVEFDFMKQTFNTPALLGEMGSGTALTNVALGIAYANHMGKEVMIAGTTEKDRVTAVVVTPPAIVRPIRAGERWFRARGGNHAYLPWWGLRLEAKDDLQGYSE